MADHVIHISEAEAASDFASVLARVRAGVEIVIDSDSESGKLPIAVIHAPVAPRRTTSECIALLPEDSTAVMDADFARDVEAAIASCSIGSATPACPPTAQRAAPQNRRPSSSMPPPTNVSFYT